MHPGHSKGFSRRSIWPSYPKWGHNWAPKLEITQRGKIVDLKKTIDMEIS